LDLFKEKNQTKYSEDHQVIRERIQLACALTDKNQTRKSDGTRIMLQENEILNSIMNVRSNFGDLQNSKYLETR
jgi:outer membrane PBP1 activator LpoA protein